MTYEAYRMSHQSSEACARALYKEARDTFNALLHARDELVAQRGMDWDRLSSKAEKQIEETMDKLEAFISARVEV